MYLSRNYLMYTCKSYSFRSRRKKPRTNFTNIKIVSEFTFPNILNYLTYIFKFHKILKIITVHLCNYSTNLWIYTYKLCTTKKLVYLENTSYNWKFSYIPLCLCGQVLCVFFCAILYARYGIYTQWVASKISVNALLWIIFQRQYKIRFIMSAPIKER